MLQYKRQGVGKESCPYVRAACSGVVAQQGGDLYEAHKGITNSIG